MPPIPADLIPFIYAACRDDLRTVGKFNLTCKFWASHALGDEATLGVAIASYKAAIANYEDLVPQAAAALNWVVSSMLDIGVPIVIPAQNPRWDIHRVGSACWVPVEPGAKSIRDMAVCCGGVTVEQCPGGSALRGVAVHSCMVPQVPLSAVYHNVRIPPDRVVEYHGFNWYAEKTTLLYKYRCLRRISTFGVTPINFSKFPCLQEVAILFPGKTNQVIQALSTIPESVTTVHLCATTIIKLMRREFEFPHPVKLGIVTAFDHANYDITEETLSTLNVTAICHMVDPWNGHGVPVSLNNPLARGLVSMCEELTTDCPIPARNSPRFGLQVIAWSGLRGRRIRVAVASHLPWDAPCRCSAPPDANQVRNAAALARETGIAHITFIILSPKCGHADPVFAQAVKHVLSAVAELDIPHAVEYSNSSFKWQICATAHAFQYSVDPVGPKEPLSQLAVNQLAMKM